MSNIGRIKRIRNVVAHKISPDQVDHALARAEAFALANHEFGEAGAQRRQRDIRPGWRSLSLTEDDYFSTIAERFLSLRGAPLFVSPADFQILDSWRSAGIPAAVVLDALEGVFSKRAKRNERGSVPLRYCAPAVEEAWERLCELVAPGLRTGETLAKAVSRLTGLE